MRLILAPMEGVMDHDMRDLLTSINTFDLCVTEFVRVTDTLLPNRVFYRTCPELLQGAKTSNGTAVRLQLLGSNPEYMALNAQRAVKLGSPGVDINFGCPSKTVNKNRGGAILLREPDQLFSIVKAVRNAVPAALPVTAKIRLGYEDKSLFLENARAVEQAGASELAVHARTKAEGYRPPAHWEYIGKIRENLRIPVIANGEVWNHDDARRCMEASGCSDLMVGRPSLVTPNITTMIRESVTPMSWHSVLQLMLQLSDRDRKNGKWQYHPSRLKQWLNYLRKAYPEAQNLFERIRSLREADTILEILCATWHLTTNLSGWSAFIDLRR
ncbi:tRNA-dihydrouridine synthase [Endozoicomonas sp. SCSIO W0465]|uniref:tRNA-dihydrouridine synthase n=1 Tax=Endozoicomonas sp. SCSIO W0465 TaxID=2918516 RepID=UPI0020765382|nr:tRNA-dihydrouridine synthase [Endozoicomonas sp. SCSIO W0465]USE33886.1 tRNA-dihydrouridine synthase [Endozoicomonas sp. SCSIO W0465]